MKTHDTSNWYHQAFYFDELYKVFEKTVLKKTHTLAHYTTTYALDQILSTGKMRATNVFYLNDNLEYKAGIRKLFTIFEEAEKIQNLLYKLDIDNGYNWMGVFTLSFANASDKLHQWVAYAKESGISIEFDTEIFSEESVYFSQQYTDIPQNDTDPRYYNTKWPRFFKICYVKQDTLKSFKKDDDLILTAVQNVVLEFVRDKEAVKENCTFDCSICKESGYFDKCFLNSEDVEEKLAGFFRLLATYYKLNTFEGEGEIRASFIPFLKCDINITERNIISHFVKANGLLKPYIEIMFTKKRFAVNEKPKPAIPIKAITVGPSGIQDAVYASIVNRVKYGDTRGVWRDDCGDNYLKKLIEGYLNNLYNIIINMLKERSKENSKLKKRLKRKNTPVLMAEYILSKWNAENDGKYGVVQEEEEDGFKINYVETRKHKSPEWKNLLSDEVLKFLDEILRYNYLSCHGIWIKKSKIGYIF